MPDILMQKLSVLRFLVMMIKKRLATDGKRVEGKVTVVLTHPPEKLDWLKGNDDPFWLELQDLGNEYQLTVLTEIPDFAAETYIVSSENLQTLVEATTPTLEDWERITHWIVKGTVIKWDKIIRQIKQLLKT